VISLASHPGHQCMEESWNTVHFYDWINWYFITIW